MQNPLPVILTTAHTDYAIESYEFNVVDYLLKPISYERFSKAINKIIDGKLPLKKTADEHIYIKSSGKFFKVNFSNIICIILLHSYLSSIFDALKFD